MPRVPLTQLKEQQKESVPDSNTEESVQKSAALWACFKCICLQAISRDRGKEKENDPDTRNRNIEEHMEETYHHKALPNTSIESADYEDRFSETDAEPGVQAARHSVNGDRKTSQSHQHFNINEEEMEAMKKMEMRLRKANRGRKLRLVLVESDSEHDCPEGEDDSCPNLDNNLDYLWSFSGNVESFGSADNQEIPENQAVRFTVQADVHHVPSGLSSEENAATVIVETDVDRENPVSDHLRVESREAKTDGKMKYPFSHVGRSEGTMGRARPNQKEDESRGLLEDQELRGKKTGNRGNVEGQTPAAQVKYSLTAGLFKQKHPKLTKVNWGDEESSESDGEWDCNGEDIRLVRM